MNGHGGILQESRETDLVIAGADDFCLGNGDASLSLSNNRLLKVPRCVQVAQRGLLNGNRSICLCLGGEIVAVVQLEQQVARMNLLVIANKEF